jgi:hypothetical protein
MRTFTREDFELAAKAAGIKVEFLEPSGRCFRKGAGAWNPPDLADDAFELAVTLHLTLRHYMGTTCAQSTVPGGPSVCVEETDANDHFKAARLAVFRAAIAIGETMP